MKAFFDDRQWDHNPKHFMANGAISPNPEHPERITILQKGAVAAGCDLLRPNDAGLGPIAEGTWNATYWSAQSAITGADKLIDGTRTAYSLTIQL